MDEWKLRLTSRDNHWFDGVVGAAVAASMQGAAISEIGKQVRIGRRRVSMVEMAAMARKKRATQEQGHG